MRNNSAIVLVPVIVILLSLTYTPVNDQNPAQASDQHLTIAEMINNNSNFYGRTGTMTANEGAGDSLLDILLEAAELVSGIDGCRLYIVGKDLDDPDTIWVQEIWDSKKDHAASLTNPGVKELINKAMPLIKAFPEKGGEYMILGGAGFGKL